MEYSLIEKYSLGDCKKDMSTFSSRLEWGKRGESMVLEALKRNVIKNTGYCPAPNVVDGENKDFLVELNAVYGDVYFKNPSTNKIEFIDVKNTLFVSQRSIDRFVDGGWYFFNAFTYSDKCYYFMVKKNQAFVDFIQPWKIDRPGKDSGYIIEYTKLPSDKSSGIEIFEMEPRGYRQIMIDLRIELERAGLPFNVIPHD